jgi:hypothetical protein
MHACVLVLLFASERTPTGKGGRQKESSKLVLRHRLEPHGPICLYAYQTTTYTMHIIGWEERTLLYDVEDAVEQSK